MNQDLKNNDLKAIKKHYGEKMMHFCREQFATLLEEPNLLLETIQNNFEYNKSLYEDLDVYGKMSAFRAYIYQQAEKKEAKNQIEIAAPENLMAIAGYDLYKCKTEEEIQEFKKYYAKEEKLCTFNGDRLSRCHVFFAVKKDVDAIKRTDFSNPERQDKYGTSVISIQFTKDDSHTLSIKNRYNHRVNNPDATFSNNLDNITVGLTESFAQYYGIKQKHVNKFELTNYVRANDGKYYKYNYEINNKYYCPNNIIIDDFEVIKLSADQNILIDYFILDLKNKQLKLYDRTIEDSFVEGLIDIKKISIVNQTNKKKTITINNFGKDQEVNIKIDKNHRIVEYANNNLQQIGKDFLYANKCLQKLTLLDLKIAGSNFLHFNESLESLFLPNLEQIGSKFLPCNRDIKTITMPKLKIVSEGFLDFNKKLESLFLPNLAEVGNRFVINNKCLKNLYLPNLKTVGSNFMNANQSIERLLLPELKKVEHSFFCDNKNMKTLIAPKLEEVGSAFLHDNKALKNLYSPNLKKIGDIFLSHNLKLKKLLLPKLEQCGNDFLQLNQDLEYIYAPNLKKVAAKFLPSNQKLKNLSLPNLEHADYNFLAINRELNDISLPKLKYAGDNFLYYNDALENLQLSNLQRVGHNFLLYNRKLKNLTVPNLEVIGDNFIMENENLENLYAPKLNERERNFFLFDYEAKERNDSKSIKKNTN